MALGSFGQFIYVHPTARVVAVIQSAWRTHDDNDAALETFAELDHERTMRRGYPEAIYCPGKTPEQLGMIAAAVRDQPHVTLFTRANQRKPK